MLINEFINCLHYTAVKENIEIATDLTDVSDIRSFLKTVVPLERRLEADLRDYDFLIFSKDKPDESQRKISVTLILDNLRSSFNVGSIFRTAECFGVSEIILCGYTATPENDKVIKTSMGTSDFVKWYSVKKTKVAIDNLKKKGIKIYALETTSNAKNIYQYKIYFLIMFDQCRL